MEIPTVRAKQQIRPRIINLQHSSVCWTCEKLAADRGGVCHACRRGLKTYPVAALQVSGWKLLGVLVCILNVIASLLAPALASPQTLPWHQVNVKSAEPFTMTPASFETKMVVEEVNVKVYPYSMVPGGAENLRQAKLAMSDPAIKHQYAGIDLAQLKQIKLATNISGYLSYRWGDEIYWTAKAMTLRAGETVYTDGKHLVRGRCLNSYSALPMLPTRPREPSEKLLDTPVEMPVIAYSFPRLPVLVPELPVPPGELTPGVPVLTDMPAGKTRRPGFWFPLIPIIPPIHRRPRTPPFSPTSPQVPLAPPIAVVPEPNYSWVLVAGFLTMALTPHWRRRAVLRMAKAR